MRLWIAHAQYALRTLHGPKDIYVQLQWSFKKMTECGWGQGGCDGGEERTLKDWVAADEMEGHGDLDEWLR